MGLIGDDDGDSVRADAAAATDSAATSYSRATISTDVAASEGGQEVNELDVDVPFTVIEMVSHFLSLLDVSPSSRCCWFVCVCVCVDWI